jgi:hypothetical protein
VVGSGGEGVFRDGEKEREVSVGNIVCDIVHCEFVLCEVFGRNHSML